MGLDNVSNGHLVGWTTFYLTWVWKPVAPCHFEPSSASPSQPSFFRKYPLPPLTNLAPMIFQADPHGFRPVRVSLSYFRTSLDAYPYLPLLYVHMYCKSLRRLQTNSTYRLKETFQISGNLVFLCLRLARRNQQSLPAGIFVAARGCPPRAGLVP